MKRNLASNEAFFMEFYEVTYRRNMKTNSGVVSSFGHKKYKPLALLAKVCSMSHGLLTDKLLEEINLVVMESFST